ncbi:MAG: response regulator [bacterium]
MNGAQTVLVVDDHRPNRLKMSLAVKNLGHMVEEAPDGQAALSRLANGGIDMVLLDIVMPEMDGFEVLRKMKADPSLREIPTLVISSLEEMTDVVKAIELGADDFLTKSFDPILLRARVNAGLERKRLRDQELEYLRQVDRLANASRMVEATGFDPTRLGLQDISTRDDALGDLSRVFVSMASEVYRREQNFRQTINLLKGGFLVLGIGALWGVTPALARSVMLDGLNPLGTVFWTLWASAVTMLCIATATQKFPKVDWANIRRFLLIGMVGTLLPQVMFFVIAQNLPAMIISLILAAQSFIIYVVAAVLGLERPSARRFWGLCLGLASIAMVILPGAQMTGMGSWVWILVAMFVPACYAGETLLLEALPGVDDEPIATATGVLVAAALLMTPIAVFSGGFIPMAEMISGSGWAFGLIGCIGAISTVLIVITIRSTGSVFAGQIGYTTTIGGIVWSIILLNEQVTPWIWAAIISMVSGVALVTPKQGSDETRSTAADSAI